MTGKAPWLREDAVLTVEDLVCDFKVSGGTVHAVSGVSFDVGPRETLGIVGESGCGKSTTARAVVQMPAPSSGRVSFEDTDLVGLDSKALRKLRRRLQIIFQDPISSLNPRRRIKDIVAEGLVIGHVAKEERAQRARQVIVEVGMDPDAIGDRRPGQFSGGQCQRIAIARAMAVRPKVLVCDEPASALDVSAQAQILNLLEDMKQEYGLSMIFISHDLAVVRNVSDRLAVMYLGKIVEIGGAEEIFTSPAHPYTSVLLSSVPIPDPESPVSEVTLGGEIPSPLDPPSGCRFRTRCPFAQEKCRDVEPLLEKTADNQYVACHFPLNGGRRERSHHERETVSA